MIILPAELYDRLETIAAKWGGIGHTRFHHWVLGQPTQISWERGLERSEPCCIYGFASLIGSEDAEIKKPKGYKRPADQLEAAGLTTDDNDNAFTKDERSDPYFRLPWAEWTNRLGVRRGV